MSINVEIRPQNIMRGGMLIVLAALTISIQDVWTRLSWMGIQLGEYCYKSMSQEPKTVMISTHCTRNVSERLRQMKRTHIEYYEVSLIFLN